MTPEEFLAYNEDWAKEHYIKHGELRPMGVFYTKKNGPMPFNIPVVMLENGRLAELINFLYQNSKVVVEPLMFCFMAEMYFSHFVVHDEKEKQEFDKEMDENGYPLLHDLIKQEGILLSVETPKKEIMQGLLIKKTGKKVEFEKIGFDSANDIGGRYAKMVKW